MVQLIRSCIKNLTAGARSIAGGRGASLARARDTTGKFWKWKFLEGDNGKIWKDWKNLGFRRITSKKKIKKYRTVKSAAIDMKES